MRAQFVNCGCTDMGIGNTEETAMRQRRRNEVIHILRYISQATSTQLTSGAFATAFMLYIGLNTEKISVVNFAANMGLFVASVLVIFAYNWDKQGLGIIRAGSVGNILIPGGMMLAGYLYLRSLKGAWILLILFSLLGNTAFSMRNSAEINAVPMLFGRERYALVTGRCGYWGGLVTLLISLLTIFVLEPGESVGYYRIFFLISTLLMLFYGMMSFGFQRPVDWKEKKQFHVDFRLLMTKKYLLASMPHLTRGIGAAALALWPATIMSHLDMTPLLSSVLIPLAIAAEIIGSYLYLKISRVMKPGTMTMTGYIISAVYMFITPCIRTVSCFFVCYFTYYLLTSAFTKALMAAFIYSCDEEELALTSSFHVLYYALAFCPAAILFGRFMDEYTVPCMTAAGVVYIISGIMMCIFFRKPISHDADQKRERK